MITPTGWVRVHYAGAMDRAKRSPGAWPRAQKPPNRLRCQLWRGKSHQAPVADGLVVIGAFATPVKDQVLIILMS